jgi:hypothetical protein
MSLYDRVHQLTSTAGTGTYTLGATVTGRVSLADALTDAGETPAGAKVNYWVLGDDDDEDFEYGSGTFDGTDQVTRDIIHSSSNANAAVNWGATAKNFILAPGASLLRRLFEIVICPPAGGTANALTLTPPHAIAGRRAGRLYIVTPTATNTTAATANPSTTGAVAIQLAGAALVGGEIVNGRQIGLYDDGTQLQLIQLAAVTELPAAVVMSGVISPAQITANQNDYAPTGIATASAIRLDLDAARSITGLTGGRAGRILRLINTSAFALTLKNEDGASTAGNRLLLGSDFVLAAGQSVWLEYDATSGRWRKAIPNITTGLPAGYLVGLALANNVSDATNDIDIAAGAARSDDNAADLSGGAMTKQLDATWAAGTAAGFRDSGDNLTGAKWFHVYAFLRTSGETDYVASTSTTPTLPGSGTNGRYIGSIYWTGSAIRGFIQRGDWFFWKTRVQDIDTTTSTTAALVTMSVPARRVLAQVSGNLSSGSGGTTVLFSCPDGDDVAPDEANGIGDIYAISGDQGGGVTLVYTNSSGQLRWRADDSGAAANFFTVGYMNRRGQDG